MVNEFDGVGFLALIQRLCDAGNAVNETLARPVAREPNTQTVESGAWRLRMSFTISNSLLPRSSGG